MFDVVALCGAVAIVLAWLWVIWRVLAPWRQL